MYMGNQRFFMIVNTVLEGLFWGRKWVIIDRAQGFYGNLKSLGKMDFFSKLATSFVDHIFFSRKRFKELI